MAENQETTIARTPNMEVERQGRKGDATYLVWLVTRGVTVLFGLDQFEELLRAAQKAGYEAGPALYVLTIKDLRITLGFNAAELDELLSLARQVIESEAPVPPRP